MSAGKLTWLHKFLPYQQVAGVLALLTQNNRHYHGLEHVEELWRRHIQHSGDPNDKVVALMIAYHDVIYDGSRKDNEKRSDDFWRMHAEVLGFDEETIEAVSAGIMATAEHPFQKDAEDHVLWMVDLDLIGLANPKKEFDRDSNQIHKETPWLSVEEYMAGRKKFFAKFLEVDRIYRTPRLSAIYESEARKNIQSVVES